MSEAMSEKEFAQFLSEEVFSGRPRSVGEALAEPADPTLPPAPPGEEEEEAPIVVPDEPGGEPEPEEEPPLEAPEPVSEEEPKAEEEEEEEGEDANVVWAKKTLGDDPAAWAKSAREKEQHIGRLAREKQEAEQLANQWYQYAQSIEQQAQTQQRAAMPLSTQEEAWIEQSLMNPLEYARAAAFSGNITLFNGVLRRIAEENALLASQIGTQVQMDLAGAAAQQQNGQAPQPLDQALGESFARLNINLDEAGAKMAQKIGELGEQHPFVQAILYGDASQRDLGVQAVYDLMRTGTVTRRKVQDDERDARIKREAELRKEAAGVVTGSPHSPPPIQQSAFMDAMEAEWRQRGQWKDEES